jgi:hypothetical protein
MKRTISILVLAALVASLLVSVVPAFAAGPLATSLSLAVSYPNGQAYANVGDNVTVTLKINTNDEIDSWQAGMGWTPAADVAMTAQADDTSWLLAQALTQNANFSDAYQKGAASSGSMTPAGNAILGSGFTGATGDGSLAEYTFKAEALGKVNLTLNSVIVEDIVNGTAGPISSVPVTGASIQVGVAPVLAVQSVSFTPGANQGQQFSASVVVADITTSAYAGGDEIDFALTGATPAVPVSQTLPALAGNGQTVINLTGLTLNSGSTNASLTATIPAFNNASNSGTYSPVSSTGTTPVDASFGAFIKITPDSHVVFASLALGSNTVTGTLNVKCNTDYEVDLSDQGTTSWHMAAYNGTAYVTPATSLTDPLSVASAQNTVDSNSTTKLVTGGVSGQQPDAGQNYPMTYSQNLHYQDPLLAAGETYHLVLTYNGYVTL